MNMWLAASLFFGGALSSVVISKFLNLYQGLQFTTELTQQLVNFLAMASQDLSMTLKMKYEALEDASVEKDEIEKIIQIDKQIIRAWKLSFAKKVYPYYPKRFRKMLLTFDWDGALRPLDNIYYNKPESKDKGGQKHEQD
jgi:hypothetical protein